MARRAAHGTPFTSCATRTAARCGRGRPRRPAHPRRRHQPTERRDGWDVPFAHTGEPGPYVLEQAITQLRAIGANDPAEAVYVFTDRDTDGAPLDTSGGMTYELRFEAGDLPPLEEPGFWSATMYKASDGLLVPTRSAATPRGSAAPASSSKQTARRPSSCPRPRPPASPRPTGSPPLPTNHSSSACGSTTQPRRSAAAPGSRRRSAGSPAGHDRPMPWFDAEAARRARRARGRNPARPRAFSPDLQVPIRYQFEQIWRSLLEVIWLQKAKYASPHPHPACS